jgi:CheY-like chemotaxis protein
MQYSQKSPKNNALFAVWLADFCLQSRPNSAAMGLFGGIYPAQHFLEVVLDGFVAKAGPDPQGLPVAHQDRAAAGLQNPFRLDFEDTILGFGVKSVRTAAGVAKALEMIAERAPDFALLDVGLLREKSFAVAERLDALKIPFIFVTGYGADVRLPAAFADRPRLPKPCSTDALQAVLKRGSNGDARPEH